MSDWLYSLDEVTKQLPDTTEQFRFRYALRHGTMKMGLFAPRDTDQQQPHKQDELYIIVAGTGQFSKNGTAKPFAPHDVIFVEAGAEHRFFNFTPDFATWVIFWGPEGGEATGSAPE